MYIPIELLSYIASQLGSNDLANFRLASRDCAYAGVALIPRHGISVINTSRDIKELHDVLQHPAIAHNVNILRIFHAQWPICSRHEWETYHLLFGGNGRVFPSTALTRQLSDKAFAAYEEHISEQQSRIYFDEISSLSEVFSLLPNLTAVHISDMHEYLWNPKSHRRFYKLQQSIWIAPFYNGNVARTVESVLLAVNTEQPKSLSISGYFDPTDLYTNPSTKYSQLRNLEVQAFRAIENKKGIRSFLLMFPNLHTLSVNFRGYAPRVGIFESICWPRLKRLDIQGLWTSETEYYNILERHIKSLVYFGLHHPSLTDGSWQSLFTKIRNLQPQPQITLSGELYGTSGGETLDMGCDERRSRLLRFLEDHHTVWPFGNTT